MPGLQQDWGYGDVGYGGLDPVDRDLEAWGPYGMDAALGDPYIADRLGADRAFDYGLGAIGGLGDLGAFGADRMLEEERFGGPYAARDLAYDADVYGRERAVRDRELGWDAGYDDYGPYGDDAFVAEHDAEERLLEDRIALDRIEVDRARAYERGW